MAMMLSSDIMPSWLNVRPYWLRLTGSSASSEISSAPCAATVPLTVTGLVWSRTVSVPDTTAPWSDSVTEAALNVMSGYLAASKKSAERRWSSRFLMPVSIDAAATVIVPVASPAAEITADPETRLKTPLTLTRPHTLLVRSPTEDLAPSRVHDPASFPSASSACTSDAMSRSQVILLVSKNSFDNGTIYSESESGQGERRERRSRRQGALGAVPAAHAVVPARVAGHAALAGPGRAELGHPPRAQARRGAAAAPGRARHRRRARLAPRPHPAHGQRRAGRPRPGRLHRPAAGPGRPAADARPDPPGRGRRGRAVAGRRRQPARPGPRQARAQRANRLPEGDEHARGRAHRRRRPPLKSPPKPG